MTKEFKNGNINIKLDADTLEEVRKEEGNFCFMSVMDELSWLDTYNVGEPFCLGNYEMGFDLYNFGRDLLYTASFSMFDELAAGKTVKLIARIPDDDDREFLAENDF